MDAKNNTLFGKDNLRWMLIGLAVIIAGIVLMSGGKTQDPTVFDVTEVYSKTRITVAPILIVVGLLIEVYAIMKKSK
jgi:cadmium resistance protein CadD (predicted permease)